MKKKTTKFTNINSNQIHINISDKSKKRRKYKRRISSNSTSGKDNRNYPIFIPIPQTHPQPIYYNHPFPHKQEETLKTIVETPKAQIKHQEIIKEPIFIRKEERILSDVLDPRQKSINDYFIKELKEKQKQREENNKPFEEPKSNYKPTESPFLQEIKEKTLTPVKNDKSIYDLVNSPNVQYPDVYESNDVIVSSRPVNKTYFNTMSKNQLKEYYVNLSNHRKNDSKINIETIKRPDLLNEILIIEGLSN